MIEIKDAILSTGGHNVLNKVSLTARDGQLTAVCGGKGSGKTTLLKAMAGLLPLDSGYVTIDTELLEPATANYFRSQMAYIPQHIDVPERMSVDELLKLLSVTRAPKIAKQQKQQAADLWAKLQLDDQLWTKTFASLTISEKRRIMLSFVLTAPCHIVIADEPTEGLTPDEAEPVRTLLRDIATNGSAVLVATKDAALESQADAKYML